MKEFHWTLFVLAMIMLFSGLIMYSHYQDISVQGGVTGFAVKQSQDQSAVDGRGAQALEQELKEMGFDRVDEEVEVG